MGVLTIIVIEEAIKTDPRSFFLGTLISRKSECVIHRSVGHRDRKKFCDLFAEFIVRTYVDDSWVLQSPRPDFLNDGPPFGQLQFRG
jgi:hypothetical protein